MCGKGSSVDAEPFEGYLGLAQRLCGVGVEICPGVVRGVGKLLDGLYCARLGVRGLDGNEDGVGPKSLLQLLHLHEAVAVRAQVGDVEACTFEPCQGGQNDVVFNLAAYNVAFEAAVPTPFGLAHRGRDAEQRRVVRLGGARREHDLVGPARIERAMPRCGVPAPAP